jgi:hypothetical protein
MGKERMMPEQISSDLESPQAPPALTAAPKIMHVNRTLCGIPRNALFDVSEDQLAYLLAILRNEPPLPLKFSEDQWLDLLGILKCHWVLPLLYRRIGTFPPGLCPPEPITDQLRMAFQESRVRSLRLERQLAEILDAFETEGVRSLVLRGPALGLSIYPDPALRPGSDLDLLVLPKQTMKVRKILEDLGYGCLGKRFEVTRDFFREEEYVHKKNPKDNLPVDLHWVHWELHPFFEKGHDTAIDSLFLRSQKFDSSTLTFETLQPVDALIHAAIHLAMIHRRDMRLIWIKDIALLADHLRVPDDWEVLQESSVKWRARLAVENCLKLAKVWFGMRLPDGFKDFFCWPAPTEDELAIWSQTNTHHWMRVLLKRSLSSPSGLLRLGRSLFHLLFPQSDIVRYCYPPSREWLLPVSYVRRWNRWFREIILDRIGSSNK